MQILKNCWQEWLANGKWDHGDVLGELICAHKRELEARLKVISFEEEAEALTEVWDWRRLA